MRILLVMDPYIPVPPRLYGGIERVVADLGNALAERGHSVTLWAAPGSIVRGAVEPFGTEGEWTRWSNVRNTITLAARFATRARQFDVVHNFGRLAYLVPIARRRVAKVQTYMRPVSAGNMQTLAKIGPRSMVYTAVSDAIRRTGAPGGGDWRVVYNCARADKFHLSTDVDGRRAPLLFLARLERCKGAHTAVHVAGAAGRELIVAGNVSTVPHERDYFERELRPLLDAPHVRYVGPVDDTQKIALLRSSAALLTPIEWDEPFPVTLPEAMLCGTPLVTFRRGGTPEGIDDGRTGFVCDTAADMVDAIGRLHTIDRRACRAEAERRFTDGVITSAYESIYTELAGAARGTRALASG
jgi:glycosyltransferase involved in cell wall biosynthesis